MSTTKTKKTKPIKKKHQKNKTQQLQNKILLNQQSLQSSSDKANNIRNIIDGNTQGGDNMDDKERRVGDKGIEGKEEMEGRDRGLKDVGLKIGDVGEEGNDVGMRVEYSWEDEELDERLFDSIEEQQQGECEYQKGGKQKGNQQQQIQITKQLPQQSQQPKSCQPSQLQPQPQPPISTTTSSIPLIPNLTNDDISSYKTIKPLLMPLKQVSSLQPEHRLRLKQQHSHLAQYIFMTQRQKCKYFHQKNLKYNKYMEKGGSMPARKISFKRNFQVKGFDKQEIPAGVKGKKSFRDKYNSKIHYS